MSAPEPGPDEPGAWTQGSFYFLGGRGWPGPGCLHAQLFRGLEAGRGQRYIIHYKLYTAYHYRTHYQLFRLLLDVLSCTLIFTLHVQSTTYH